MTSRRCVVLEQGVREQLQRAGYTVQTVPPVFSRNLPPAHLIATRDGETRYIRLRKISRQGPTVETVARFFGRDLIRFRTCMWRRPMLPGLRYELWLCTVCHGITCFEVTEDRVKEIPRIPPSGSAIVAGGSAA